MMMNRVDYKIILPDQYHEKGITNIMNPTKDSWLTSKPRKQVSIIIQHPRCIIQRFDIFNNNTPKIGIILRDTKNDYSPVYSKTIDMFQVTDPQPKTQTIYKENISSKATKPSDQIEINLLSPNNRQIGLTYFLIYSLAEKDSVQKSKLDQKVEKVQQITVIDSDEDANLQKALKLSREQYEKNNRTNRIEPHKIEQETKSLSQFRKLSRQSQHQNVEGFKMNERKLKILDDVTDDWIQQQKLIERKKSIPLDNSILKYCRQKPFKGQRFYAVLSKKKDEVELIESALRLGLNYSPEPISQCYIFCESRQTLKNKLSTLRDVKILKPDYIYDCLERWRVVDFRDYILY